MSTEPFNSAQGLPRRQLSPGPLKTQRQWLLGMVVGGERERLEVSEREMERRQTEAGREWGERGQWHV